MTANPGPPGFGLGMRPIPLFSKKISITETVNSNGQCYKESRTTTCVTPNDDFLTWEGGLMAGTGVSRKEKSLASPNSIMKIGTWKV